MNRGTVSDVMTRRVITARPDTSFKEAVWLLKRHRISALPVVDEEGKPVGILSEADLLRKLERRNLDSYLLESRQHRLDRAKALALDAASAMTREVTLVRPEVPVALAARLLHTKGFKRLPVVDEAGRLVGIVSRGDLLKVFLRSDSQIRADVRTILAAAGEQLGGRRLKVSVQGGIVELDGQVATRSRLESVVRSISWLDGVVGVRDRLTYELDDTGPLAALYPR